MPVIVPSWENEIELCAAGNRLIAGVDEAGRGAWAGPLVAAAVILPPPGELGGLYHAVEVAEALAALRDSKMLSPSKREELMGLVRSVAVSVGVGVVSSALLDVIGVGPGNRLAMTRAVRDLGVRPDYLLLDAFKLPTMPLPQRPIIKGDAKCISIAAASVVAKVTRDRIMQELDAEHPAYRFARHKGYGTRTHAEALLREGVSPVHRRCFAPVRAALLGLPWPPRGVESADEGEDEDGEERESQSVMEMDFEEEPLAG
ncbi:MAG TPA: ribonuclease HII [Chloroflexia bacterium]|nr:ribonuclease HII [Chloroflexia bacterium]